MEHPPPISRPWLYHRRATFGPGRLHHLKVGITEHWEITKRGREEEMRKRWCKFIIVYLLIWAAAVGAARPKGVRTGDTQIGRFRTNNGSQRSSWGSGGCGITGSCP